MLVTDFDYELPKELIAQHPMEPRDHSRLLVVNKDSGAIEHKHFYDLIEYLHPLSVGISSISNGTFFMTLFSTIFL